MKLLLATIDFHPKVGGVATFGHEFATALAEAGANVSVLLPDGFRRPPGSESNYRVISDADADVQHIEGETWGSRELPRAVTRLTRLQNESQFDRFIALHPHYYGQILTRVGQQTGTPVSIVMHGTEVRSHTDWQSRYFGWLRTSLLRGRSIGREFALMLEHADEILTNSESTRDLILQRRSSARVCVTGCGLNRIQVEAAMSADPIVSQSVSRRVLNVGESDFVIGTVCRLVASKGVDDLLKVTARVQNAICVIIGDGPDRRGLEALAVELGISKRVRFLGWTNENEKQHWLQAMDVFLLLSKPLKSGEIEGFGISILEAQAAQTLVIGTHTGGIYDALDGGDAGFLISPGNIDAASNILADIRIDPKIGQTRIEAGIRNLATRFRWDVIAQKVLTKWQSKAAG